MVAKLLSGNNAWRRESAPLEGGGGGASKTKASWYSCSQLKELSKSKDKSVLVGDLPCNTFQLSIFWSPSLHMDLASVLVLGERQLVDADYSILLELYLSSFTFFIKNSWNSIYLLGESYALFKSIAYPPIIRAIPLVFLIFKWGS